MNEPLIIRAPARTSLSVPMCLLSTRLIADKRAH